MKKGILLLLGMLMMVSTVEATDGTPNYWGNSELGYFSSYRAKPIQFIEKGIKFYVYPNGRLDFNSRKRSKYSRQYYYRNGRRYARTYPYRNRGLSYDYYGRVKRVGNVYINYNRLGKVTRVGSVFVDYKHRRLTRVGNLRIKYNKYGDVRYYGRVKPHYSYRPYRYDSFYNGMILDYDDDYFINDSFYDDFEDYDEDDQYFYYKSKKGKGHKESKVIKRKKVPLKEFEDRKRR